VRVETFPAGGLSINVVQTEIPEVLIFEPKVNGDQRGFFCETYHLERYAAYGITGPFLQDSVSRSARGVLRGLHFNTPGAKAS
jgi:dTDP-4-dehydrorhamnose 3,5-epimerase